MDMIIILVGLALLLVLTLKKVPVVYAAAISVIFIALFSRLPVVSTMTGDYMTGFANFVKSLNCRTRRKSRTIRRGI